MPRIQPNKLTHKWVLLSLSHGAGSMGDPQKERKLFPWE
jgi:hypothetical protein